MAINTGNKAPDFTLVSFTPSADPTDITLSSFNGKKNVVLLFFPQAFTGVCTEQICTMNESFNDFEGFNADESWRLYCTHRSRNREIHGFGESEQQRKSSGMFQIGL